MTLRSYEVKERTLSDALPIPEIQFMAHSAFLSEHYYKLGKSRGQLK